MESCLCSFFSYSWYLLFTWNPKCAEKLFELTGDTVLERGSTNFFNNKDKFVSAGYKMMFWLVLL